MKQNLDKIISGGQTGADIAGADAAIALGIPYGGTIPKGRRSENGIIPEVYTEFVESKHWQYPVRTEMNVKDSDGTVIFVCGPLAGGSEATRKLAVKHVKPVFIVNFNTSGLAANTTLPADLRMFVQHYNIKILNVAGSRESKSPGIHDKVVSFLIEAFKI